MGVMSHALHELAKDQGGWWYYIYLHFSLICRPFVLSKVPLTWVVRIQGGLFQGKEFHKSTKRKILVNYVFLLCYCYTLACSMLTRKFVKLSSYIVHVDAAKWLNLQNFLLRKTDCQLGINQQATINRACLCLLNYAYSCMHTHNNYYV